MSKLCFLFIFNVIICWASDEPPNPNPVLVTPRNFFEASGYVIENDERLISLLKFDQKEIVIVRVSNDVTDEGKVNYKNFKSLIASQNFSRSVISLDSYGIESCKHIKTGFIKKLKTKKLVFNISCLRIEDGEEVEEVIEFPFDSRLPIFNFN